MLSRIGDPVGSPLGVIWHDNRNRFTSGIDIFMATSSDRGVTFTPDLLLVGRTGNQKSPTLIANPAGSMRILYRDETRPPEESLRLLR
jgi:hypothetical protein